MDDMFITEYFDWAPLKPSRRVERVNALLKHLRLWVRLTPPRFTGLMTNVEQRMNMFHLVSQVLAYGVPGDIVELGCHAGQSSVLIQKVIDHHDPTRRLHVYDSFAGLPEGQAADGRVPFAPGDLKASTNTLVENFRRHGLRVPEIHVGWFQDTLPTELPGRICFAHLDGDYYESIMVSLEHVYPRLSPGAICLIDDYHDPSFGLGWNLLPGVKKACDEFLADKPERVSMLYAAEYSHGYFRKQ